MRAGAESDQTTTTMAKYFAGKLKECFANYVFFFFMPWSNQYNNLRMSHLGLLSEVFKRYSSVHQVRFGPDLQPLEYSF